LQDFLNIKHKKTIILSVVENVEFFAAEGNENFALNKNLLEKPLR